MTASNSDIKSSEADPSDLVSSLRSADSKDDLESHYPQSVWRDLYPLSYDVAHEICSRCEDYLRIGSTGYDERFHFKLSKLPWESLSLAELREGEAHCGWYSIFAQALRKCLPSLSHDDGTDELSWSCWGNNSELIPKSYSYTVGTVPSVALFYVRGKFDPFHLTKYNSRILTLTRTLTGEDDTVRPLADNENKWTLYPMSRPLRWADFHHKKGNDGSPSSHQQALEWFKKCRNNHPECLQANEEFRPTRLLSLRDITEACENVAEVQLVETAELESRVKIEYACLSHCWGGVKPPCITTPRTIHQNKHNIPWSRIPKTFRDVIQVVRTLGLEYLWIDSLCILQFEDGYSEIGNSEARADWLRESSAMADIYSNATITIAAASAENCNAGLYRTETSSFHAHELDIPTTTAAVPSPMKQRSAPSPPRIYAQARMEYWHDKEFPSRNNSAWPPLAKRGWFFQEWRLSPRILHYDLGELVWQCKCGVISQWDAVINRPFPSTRIGHPISDGHSGQEDDATVADYEWLNMVSAYTKLDLSFPQDRLPAISGIVKTTRQFKRGDTYAAGLWEESMPWHLAWTTRERPLKPRPGNPGGPSWSWASVETEVEYCAEHRSDIAYSTLGCVVDNVACVPFGDDPTGFLKSAQLTISGFAFPCTIDYDMSDMSKKCNDEKTSFVISGISCDDGSLHCRLQMRLGTFEEAVLKDMYQARVYLDYALYEPGTSYIATGTQLQCLRFLNIPPISIRGDQGESLFLLLVKSTRVAGAYERIGLLETPTVQDWQDPAVPKLFQQLDSQQVWSKYVVV